MGVGVNALKALHVSRNTQSRIKNGEPISLSQFYVTVRWRLSCEKSDVGRMRILGQIMDCLERDYADYYGNGGALFDGGCRETVDRFISGWVKHLAEKDV